MLSLRGGGGGADQGQGFDSFSGVSSTSKLCHGFKMTYHCSTLIQ